MTKKKTTIMDIANALGMSRNTISKALNGNGNVSDKNKEAIYNKAKELNYKGFIYGQQEEPKSHSGNIVFLTKNFSVQELFWPIVVNGIEEILSQANYNFSIKLIREDDLMKETLPLYFNSNEIDGIICTEIYHKPYIDKLVATNIPLILIDAVYDVFEFPLKYDIILMENSYSIQNLMNKLLELGHEKIGFVGQINYCRSFYERFIGFNQSFTQKGLVAPTAFNIIPDEDNYSVEWLMQKMKGLAELPTAFVCANDAIAINVMSAAKNLGLRIPEDLSITGFDDISEVSFIEPRLTTVAIQKESLGNRAAEILLWRLQNPMRPFSITYIENVIHFRDSVLKPKK